MHYCESINAYEKEIYILPVITRDGQKTSVEVLIDDESLRRWLSLVRRRTPVFSFEFIWANHLPESVGRYWGRFCAVYKTEGIYVKAELLSAGGWYRDVVYPIDEFWRMMSKNTRPSIGLCVTVTVTVD